MTSEYRNKTSALNISTAAGRVFFDSCYENWVLCGTVGKHASTSITECSPDGPISSIRTLTHKHYSMNHCWEFNWPIAGHWTEPSGTWPPLPPSPIEVLPTERIFELRGPWPIMDNNDRLDYQQGQITGYPWLTSSVMSHESHTPSSFLLFRCGWLIAISSLWASMHP